MSKWVEIPEAEAKSHALYGVRGWLMFFVVTQVLGFLRTLAEMNGAAQAVGMTTYEFLSWDHAIGHMMRWSFVATLITVASVVILVLMKPRSFRVVTTILLAVYTPLEVAGAFIFPIPPEVASAMGPELVKGFVGWVLYTATWSIYFYRSRRVRVTFEHKVRA